MNVLEMNNDQLVYAAQAMEAYGGGFASRIALAFFAADLGNRARLVVAFSDLFERYGPGSMFYEQFAPQESANG